MKYRVLNYLKEAGDYVSGEKISQDFDVTRAYIWKCIDSLREDGYRIDSIKNKGYRLLESPDLLNQAELETYLETEWLGRNLEYFKTIDSSNNYAKSIASQVEEGYLIVAEEQTAGRGRLGRDWQSSYGKGLYFSLILKPDLAPEKASRLTLMGASALVLALDSMGVRAGIKWPNDLIVNGKKVAGILTEMAGQLNSIDYLVMGIGVNVNNSPEDIEDSIRHKASSIYIEEARKLERSKLLARTLNEFEDLYLAYLEDGDFTRTLDIARERSLVIGRSLRLIRGDQEEEVYGLDIAEDGQLLVRGEDGRERKLSSGEISIRGKDSYI